MNIGEFDPADGAGQSRTNAPIMGEIVYAHYVLLHESAKSRFCCDCSFTQYRLFFSDLGRRPRELEDKNVGTSGGSTPVFWRRRSTSLKTAGLKSGSRNTLGTPAESC